MKKILRFACDIAMLVPAAIGYHLVVIWPTKHLAKNFAPLADQPNPDRPQGEPRAP